MKELIFFIADVVAQCVHDHAPLLTLMLATWLLEVLQRRLNLDFSREQRMMLHLAGLAYLGNEVTVLVLKRFYQTWEQLGPVLV